MLIPPFELNFMKIFVINSGSSSIKYQLISMPEKLVVCSGLVESIALANAAITHRIYKDGREEAIRMQEPIKDHAEGFECIRRLLTDGEAAVIREASEINVVGHRVVHGGEDLSAPMLIDESVKTTIERLFTLAPLHNPANHLGITIAEKIFPSARQVAVFDTAFHHTMPEKAFRFAIPSALYHDHQIRVYGFHGTSHKYVSREAIRYLRKSSSRIVTIHLGNGCSMAAVANGTCVDTSMGFGPLDGLIMGTRSGNIDPSVIFQLVDQLGYSLQDVNTLLNKNSGMLGLTGFSDMRSVRRELANGSQEARLAYDMYAYRVRKYIGAYAAVLNGLDAIVFTGGVGENDPLTRKLVTANMDALGIVTDSNKNEANASGLREINTDDSAVKILVIPTNEELEIATQCYDLLQNEK
jgi:acetate kinase